MSPRYEDDPRPRNKKDIPIGLIAGCGLFAILIIGTVIWVLINLIDTVSDAAKPSEDGVQTSVIAPGQEGSSAIPGGDVNSNNNDIPEGNVNNGSDVNQSSSDSNTTDESDNVVYVTETVVAED